MRALLVAVLFCAACKPDFGTPLSLLSAPRILAVRGQPAEAPPGATLQLDALVAGPDGPQAMPSLDWSVCHAQTPLTASGVVSPACLSIRDVDYLIYGKPSVSTTMPMDACQLFGPDLPPQTADMTVGRATDPDATGGYYQPFRADLGDAFSVALERLRCNLRGASMDAAQQFHDRYHDNQNPTLVGVTGSLSLDAVPAGATVTLTAAWTADSPEVYPVLDLATQTLVDHRESMRVSWYATAGAFTDERTGRDENDPALDTSNTFTAPTTPGTVHVFVVLRDSRGGVAWAYQPLVVVP
jgi:hypothetical protein